VDITVSKVETADALPVARRRPGSPVRPRFPQRAWIVTAGLALAAPLAPFPLAAADQNPQVCPGPAFSPVSEIKSRDGKLQAVIKVMSGERTVPTQAGPLMLRYFMGYDPAAAEPSWPGSAGPGPTLRGELGDVVQITFLNQVRVQDFGGTLDSGDEGRSNGCDEVTNAATGENLYPSNDKFPNCFHASSSANIHFHGTHVTPATTGDNVLITVRPNAKVSERDVKGPFQQIFQHCELRQQPKRWEDLPQSWRDFQETLLKEYDATAPYVGPGRNESGHGLPRDLQLWPQNRQASDHGLWPQWYSGSYPYCFQLPRCPVDKPCGDDLRMGQAPGTQWYHSHKHGSTALNLFNGLAGAFIIADDRPDGYDGKLKAFYGGKLDEKVLVLQQLSTVLNLMSAKGSGPPKMLVNGQLAPTITMRPGEVQLWRIVNASVQGFVNASFTPAGGNGITFRQTAQDGVQLSWENYSRPENGTQAISLAPANRVDLLVQAPSTGGCFTLGPSNQALVSIAVTGEAVAARGFPSRVDDYPRLPDFLKDVDAAKIHVRRDITYGSQAGATGRKLLQFTIDGKQFEDQVINQVMRLDSAEEWTVYNTDTLSGASAGGTNIAHPFHIHVNPFQVVEVFTPGANEPLQKPRWPVWWDTFAIPPAAKLAAGQTCPVPLLPTGECPGYFKMRTRFVDFTGQYVQHCHILAHEDRGMMQLLEVVDDTTLLKHH
jgi:FtsP/CotA-like multicopper oxidase with cupredoxin domain